MSDSGCVGVVEEIKQKIRNNEICCGRSVAVMFPDLAEEVYREQQKKPKER